MAVSVQVVLVVTFYMVAALVMVFVNKLVLNTSPTIPMLFMFFQSFTTVPLLALTSLFLPSLISIPPLFSQSLSTTTYTTKNLALLILVDAAGFVFNTLCPRDVEAAFYQVARGLVLPLTITVVAITSRTAPRLPVVFCAAVVTIGFLLGVTWTQGLPASAVISPRALFYRFLSSLSIAVHAVLIKSLLAYVQKIQEKQRNALHSSIRSLSSSPLAGPSNATYPEPVRREKPLFKSPQSNTSDDHTIAMLMQLQYDEENMRIAEERGSLRNRPQVSFDCGVCFERFPEDDMVMVQPCRHSFCRSCARQYILTKLGEHRFPVFCPSCTNGTNQSEIDNDIIQIVGIPDKDFAEYEEMQLAAFSTLLHCRRCQSGVFVDREELQATKIIVCPLPACNHVWCKACQQTVEVGGPQHSCDGSSELKRLMEEHGWKHCPGCDTPIEKQEGCNHMTCLSRGCNTHFCYLCGVLIIQSASRGMIQSAVAHHYRRCQLFRTPA